MSVVCGIQGSRYVGQREGGREAIKILLELEQDQSSIRSQCPQSALRGTGKSADSRECDQANWRQVGGQTAMPIGPATLPASQPLFFTNVQVERFRLSPWGTSQVMSRPGWAVGGALLRCLRRRIFRLALLTGGGLAVPGTIGAQCGRVVEAVLVINAIGSVELCVLQPRDKALILITKLSAHQGWLAHHHHILRREEGPET